MTKEEEKAINGLKILRETVESDEDHEIFDTAIKAIEKASALDKIRREIMDTGAYEQEVHGKTEFLKGITYCLNVIDKYMIN